MHGRTAKRRKGGANWLPRSSKPHKDWISREILFHGDADAVVQHCEPGSEKNVGFRYTRFALIEDESTSDAARGKERPVFNTQYPQVNLLCTWTSTKLDQKRERAGARNASNPSSPVLSGMKGGRICGEDCVQGTETGWKFDQSSPSTFTLLQTNDHSDATEPWSKVIADGFIVEHLLDTRLNNFRQGAYLRSFRSGRRKVCLLLSLVDAILFF